MKLSKRANYLLIFGFLGLLNVLFRFPVTPHELGADSFYVHGMANFISTNGYAKWIMHPLSFFGLYPLSYPSGGIFYLSSISQCTGIDTEYSILVVSTFLGVLGAFTTYLLAKEIFNDDFFAFATAFIFSTSRIFLTGTTWVYSTRGFFIVLLPLFIWSLLRFSSSERKEKLKYIMLAGVLLIILGTIHHIVLLIPLVLIAYFIALLLNVIKHKFESPFIRRVIPPVFFALFTALFLMQFTGFTIYSPSYHEFQRGYFFQGSESHIILLNMGIRYAMSIGILIILIPIGLVSLVFKSNKKLPEIFLLVLLLCFTPFLMDSRYTITFLVPVLSLFISLGLLAIPKAISKVKFKRAEKVVLPILMMILLFSAFLPSFVVLEKEAHRPGYTYHMSERTYNAGLFMKDYGNGSTISNYGFTRIKATSGDLIFEDPDKYDFSTVKRVPLSVIISKKMDTFFVIQDCYFNHRSYYTGLHWYGIRDCDNTFTKKILSGDNIRYAITNNYYPSKGAFFVSVQKKKYKIYDDSLGSIWYLGR